MDLVDNDEKQSKYKYLSEIQQMMFVFGEKNDALTETAMLIEDIVRTQVIEMVVSASKLANNRNTRSVSPEDLIFLIRRDRAKVNRLRTFLAWKDVRKNTKESGGNEAVEDLIEDGADKPALKKMSVKLPWELLNSLTSILDSDSEGDEESRDAFNDSLQRLKNADAITQLMSREEYVFYSECRQASFTYRKSKKFKEWCHMASYMDTKANDDLIDILGFLTFEMVGGLTELAIDIKLKQQQQSRMNLKKSLKNSLNSTHYKKVKRENEDIKSLFEFYEQDEKVEKIEDKPNDDNIPSIFDPPKGSHKPLEKADIHEAFRILQANRRLPLRNFTNGLVRTRVTLI
ncbi:TFIID-18kDa-domain-containing protein [Neoconidiobolus thromboides FSU 785]|nr:TFIID-18kDa-domain-containing protein [Neoconidiobolus thromboides FSU 785]